MWPTPAVVTAPPLAVVVLTDFSSKTNIVRKNAVIFLGALVP